MGVQYICAVFTFALWVLTATQSFHLYFFSFVFVLFVTYFYQNIIIWGSLKREKHVPIAWVVLWVYLFVWGVVSIFLSNKKSFLDIPHSHSLQEKSSIVFSWTLVWWRKDNNYVVLTPHWQMLVRGLGESFTYGDRLLISWYVRSVYEAPSKVFSETLMIPSLFFWTFDYPRRLWIQWYVADVWVNSVVSIESRWEAIWLNNLDNVLLIWKRRLRYHIQEVYLKEPHQALLWGLLYGDISLMQKEQYDDFIRSNLAHLVAVSGGNLIMLAWFLLFLLFFIPVYFRYVCVFISLVLYSMLVWMEWSVFRAVLMWCLWVIALFFWRTVYIWRFLTISWIVILCVRPYSLWYDVWFLLSFSALVGIVGFLDVVRFLVPKVVEKTGDIGSLMLANIWATFWVVPVLVFFMWKFSLLWFFANMMVLPLVPFITITWWASLFLWWVIWSFFVKLTSALLEYIYMVSIFFSDVWWLIEIDILILRYGLCIFLVLFYLILYTWSFWIYKKNLQ